MAEIHADGAEGDWQANPTTLDISQREVEKGSRLAIKLATGEGRPSASAPSSRGTPQGRATRNAYWPEPTR